MEKYAPRNLNVGTPITSANTVAAKPPARNASGYGHCTTSQSWRATITPMPKKAA